jgi:thioredoxin 1
MKTINSTQEFDQIIEKGGLVIADFYAEWCGPCQTLLPILESVSNEQEGAVEIVKQDLASRYGVRTIPTLLFFQNQNVIDKTVGVQTKSDLETKITELHGHAN